MADYITLLGAEQVQSAAGTMREAADRMQRAADTMAEALQRHQTFMDDWLERYKQINDDMPF